MMSKYKPTNLFILSSSNSSIHLEENSYKQMELEWGNSEKWSSVQRSYAGIFGSNSLLPQASDYLSHYRRLVRDNAHYFLPLS